MSIKSPDICPLGLDLQKYWDRRYQYFARFDEGIQIDAEGLYSVIPEETGLQQASHIIGATVVDAFGGVGGSAIALARSGKKVVSIEIDPGRSAMSRHNASVYGVEDEIDFICDDFLNVASTIIADTVNLDPPWGGPAYKELGKFLLEHFSPDGNKLLELSLEHFSEVVLRVPIIFDMSEIDKYTSNYSVYDDLNFGTLISRTVIIQGS